VLDCVDPSRLSLVEIGLELTEGASFTSELLACVNTNTLRSQPRQAYAHFVDFSGEAMSILPLGQSEHRDEDLISQAELWEDGEMKPAPLNRSEILAITIETETIGYRP
jgi:hypothetical protein